MRGLLKDPDRESQDIRQAIEADERLVHSVQEGVRQYQELLESADSSAIAIMLTIWHLSGAQRLANEKAFAELDLPVNVAGNRLTILRTLYFAPERRMAVANLSRETGLTVSWVTSLVETLGQAGLVRRMGSAEDRRVSIVCLTPDGEEAFRGIVPAMGEAMAQTCRNLSEEEKQQLLALLHRLF